MNYSHSRTVLSIPRRARGETVVSPLLVAPTILPLSLPLRAMVLVLALVEAESLNRSRIDGWTIR